MKSIVNVRNVIDEEDPFEQSATCSCCDDKPERILRVGNEQGVAVLRLCRVHRLAIRRVLGDWTA